MAELKTKMNDGDVSLFIAGVADPNRQKDSETLVSLMSDATGTTPTMWGSSIIGFGTMQYTTSDGKKNDWMRIGFSPRKQNMTLYLMTSFNEYADSSGFNPKTLLSKLGPHSTGKSCLYIKKLDDVDLNILTELVKQSYHQAGLLNKHK